MSETTWSGHQKGTAEYRRMLIALFSAGIATFGLMNFPQAILPLLSRTYGVDEAEAALTVSVALGGLALAVLPWSRVGDRLGRTASMKLAVVVAVVIGFVIPFAPDFTVMIGLRALQGLALGGIPALAMTYLNEETDARHAVLAAGSYISGTSIGGLVGRLVVAPIAELGGWRAGALGIAAMAAAAAVIFIVMLPPARRFESPSPGDAHPSMWQGIKANIRRPSMLVLYVHALALMGGYVALYNYLGFRLEQKPFGLSVTVVSAVFLTGLVGAVSSRVASRLAVRFGRRTVLGTASVLMGLSALATLPDWLPLIALAIVGFSASFFGAHAIASGWVGQRATTGVAQAAALYSLAYYVGAGVFGWLGGIAFRAGWVGTATMIAILCFSATGSLLLCPGLRDRPTVGRHRGRHSLVTAFARSVP